MVSLEWILGVFVHVVYLLAIFDIYYSSPLLHDLPVFPIDETPPASRLVLFVADGLRAESFFQNPNLTPNLRQNALVKGSWGVSHTRVPTESRPGHVAIIAGFYEDVASVTRGWKENPVEFDSVFNRSKITYAWGSPDILPMFAKGAAAKNVITSMYDANKEDFGAADPSKLDTWVFNSIEEFFRSAKANDKVANTVRGNGVVFFLHLLGLDTNGHGNKPHSAAYLENIALVDKGVKEIEKLMEDFYGPDGRTAFIFTSDHGMTDWGSHGAGLPHETETPLVVWGAGVRIHQGSWGLAGSGRQDVEQADIAPLISALLGLPIPVNSVGRLPKNYLNVTENYEFAAVKANFNQVKVQFLQKREEKRLASFEFLFHEFPKLNLMSLASAEETVARLLTEQNGLPKAINIYRETIPLMLEGLMYFHRYERFILGCFVAFGFFCWIIYVIVLLTFPRSAKFSRSGPETMTLAVSLVEIIAMLAHGWHWPGYVYVLMPNFLLDLSYKSTKRFGGGVLMKSVSPLVLSSVATIFLTEFIIATFFERKYLTVAVLGGAIWCLVSSRGSSNRLRFGWISLSFLTATFLWLPPMGSVEHKSLVLGCAMSLTVISAVFTANLSIKNSDRTSKADWAIRTLAFLFATLQLASVTTSNQPSYFAIISWTLLILSFCGPVVSKPASMERLMSLILFLYVPYLLLSLSFEALFYLSFVGLLRCWIELEQDGKAADKHLLQNISTINKDHRISTVSSDNIRRAFMLVMLVMLAFFGTGNLSSLNSFNPNSVRCFLTVFNPFVMGGLLLIKIFIPILVVCCVLEELLRATNTSAETLFLLALIIFDFMAVHFFFLLKDVGSWLDIGTSISHYVIMLSTTLVLFCLHYLAKFLSAVTLRRDDAKPHVH